MNGFTYEETEDKAIEWFAKRIGEAMNFKDFKKSDLLCFHPIRDVSSKSHMYCNSFRLPKEVAFAQSEIYKLEPAAQKK